MAILGFVKDFFTKYDRLIAFFIDDTNHFRQKKVKYVNNSFDISLHGKKQTYIVDHHLVYYRSKDNRGFSFYIEGNPHPVIMPTGRHEEIDAIGFRQIIDSKMVEDLFKESTKDMIMILLIICGINLLISIFLILMQTHILKMGGSG